MIYLIDSNLSVLKYMNFWSEQKETRRIMYMSYN